MQICNKFLPKLELGKYKNREIQASSENWHFLSEIVPFNCKTTCNNSNRDADYPSCFCFSASNLIQESIQIQHRQQPR